MPDDEPILPDYCVVEANSLADFRNDIRDLLQHGWKCQGGVCTLYIETEDPRKGYTEGETWFAQAMVKELP